jgi:hypothetical protein
MCKEAVLQRHAASGGLHHAYDDEDVEHADDDERSEPVEQSVHPRPHLARIITVIITMTMLMTMTVTMTMAVAMAMTMLECLLVYRPGGDGLTRGSRAGRVGLWVVGGGWDTLLTRETKIKTDI